MGAGSATEAGGPALWRMGQRSRALRWALALAVALIITLPACASASSAGRFGGARAGAAFAASPAAATFIQGAGHIARAAPSQAVPDFGGPGCIVRAASSSVVDNAENSSLADVIEVECEPADAGAKVRISSDELNSKCHDSLKWAAAVEGSFGAPNTNSVNVELGMNGNAAAVAYAEDCMAGEVEVSAELLGVHKFTATTTLTVEPPQVLAEGLIVSPSSQLGYEGDVATVVYISLPPEDAEEDVSVNTGALQYRCGKGAQRKAVGSNGEALTVNGGNVEDVETDNDGNAYFVLFDLGSCAAGQSELTAVLGASPHTTLTKTFTITPQAGEKTSEPAGCHLYSLADLHEDDITSSIADFIEVSCPHAYAGHSVELASTGLNGHCQNTLSWAPVISAEPGAKGTRAVTVTLDKDGNASVVAFGGPSCQPGEVLISAVMTEAPYEEDTTGFTVLAPEPLTPGVTALPSEEFENAENNSAAAIVQLAFEPTDAEDHVNVNSSQVYNRCAKKLKWVGREAKVLAADAEELSNLELDNDGVAWVVLFGREACFGGDSLVEASLETAPFTTYTTEWAFGIPATVDVGSATEVTSAAGTLKGTVNPNREEVTGCHFEYGTSLAYGSSVECSPPPGHEHEPVAVTGALSSLTANTTYHFRIAATNAFGTSYSGDQTFTTLATAATGTTEEAKKPAEANDGQLKAVASGGTGKVTIGPYGSDIGGTPLFKSTGNYIDVYRSTKASFTEIEFKDCELNGAKVIWWDNPATGWEPISEPPAVYSGGATPCITVTITESTKPDVAQMIGTRFGFGEQPGLAEYGKCGAQKDGAYKEGGCLTKDFKKGLPKGKYEWYPVTVECYGQKDGRYQESKCLTLDEKKGKPKGAFEKGISAFTATTGTAKLEIHGSGTVQCEASTAEGGLETLRIGVETVTYTDCKHEGSSCSSANAPAGTIHTFPLETLMYEEAGKIFTGLIGSPLMKFTCDGTEYTLSGGVSGETTGDLNVMSTKSESVFKSGVGDQVLETEDSHGAFETILTETSVTNGQATEIDTKANG